MKLKRAENWHTFHLKDINKISFSFFFHINCQLRKMKFNSAKLFLAKLGENTQFT